MIKSIIYACRGLRYAFLHEQNFRIQVGMAAIVLLFAFLLHVRLLHFLILLSLIMFVLILELINTAVEKMLDVIKPRLSFHVEEVKDVMAGAVLVAAFGAGVIGMLIFLPYIVELVHP
ncbi:MAG TPA: diacylglycerol kinase family protein [Candidatus Kapabacteria bacterium]|nr:diacylglycerol kinase family protein [Candidatus Kapabacteria bacterium]